MTIDSTTTESLKELLLHNVSELPNTSNTLILDSK